MDSEPPANADLQPANGQAEPVVTPEPPAKSADLPIADPPATTTITYEEREKLFVDEWSTYIKKQITIHYEHHFHLWMALGGGKQALNKKMEQLANKHFRGMLTHNALCHLSIFVALLLDAVGTYSAIVDNKGAEVAAAFAEKFSRSALRDMESWNWHLTDRDARALQPFRAYDFEVDPREDEPALNEYGLPSWIKVTVGDHCSCCDSGDDEESEDDRSSVESE
jgi:hypothetical protein